MSFQRTFFIMLNENIPRKNENILSKCFKYIYLYSIHSDFNKRNGPCKNTNNCQKDKFSTYSFPLKNTWKFFDSSVNFQFFKNFILSVAKLMK